MRTYIAKRLSGKHLDYGTNDGHVAKRLFGRNSQIDLYVADIAYNINKDNAKIASKFLLIDRETGSVQMHAGVFDSISCIHVLEHLKDVAPVMTEFMRLLKPGGCVYIETPNSRSLLIPSLSKGRTWNFYDDATHVRPYDAPDLIDLCERHGFEIIRAGISRSYAYSLTLPVAPLVSLILRDWRPIHYALVNFIGCSSYVLCRKPGRAG